jgi:regulator of RNase E activity RraB
LSDQWDFYFARIDDAVASIFVDLGLRDEAPVEARPWLLWVTLEMSAPRPDGLSSEEESEVLNGHEDSLDATISAVCGAQYVGRVTGSGRRQFFFYAAEPAGFDDAVANLLQDSGYTYESASTFQPDWEQYLTVLYPSDSNLQRMANRRVLENLEDAGDVHELPRKVDHAFRFADEDARARCRETLAAIDFSIDAEEISEEAGDALPFTLLVSRVDSVDMHTINGITLELDRLAREHGGDYDGWGCEVMTSDAEGS